MSFGPFLGGLFRLVHSRCSVFANSRPLFLSISLSFFSTCVMHEGSVFELGSQTCVCFPMVRTVLPDSIGSHVPIVMTLCLAPGFTSACCNRDNKGSVC